MFQSHEESYIFDIRNPSPLKAMTIIITSPSTGVTELTSETFQAEGYEIDMDECCKIYNMLGIQIFPSELYNNISTSGSCNIELTKMQITPPESCWYSDERLQCNELGCLHQYVQSTQMVDNRCDG